MPIWKESSRKKGCVNLVCLYTRFIWHQMKYLRRYLTLLVTGSKPEFSVATPSLVPIWKESSRKKGCVNLVCLYTRFIWHQMKYLRRYLTLLVTGSKPGFSVATPFLMPIWKRKYPEERLDEPCLPIYMIHMASYEVS